MQDACEEPGAADEMGPWAVTLSSKSDELQARSLVVGLRKNLRERVADVGGKVMACMYSALDTNAQDPQVLESFFLDAANNFRCEFPDLEEKPLTLHGGIRVRFSVMNDDRQVRRMCV